MRGVYFYGFLVAFAVGTAVALLERTTLGSATLVLLIAVAGCGVCVLRDRKIAGTFCIGLIILCGFGVGALHTSWTLYQENESVLDSSMGEHTTLEAVIVEDPVVTQKNQKVIFKVEDERDKVIAFAPVYPQLHYGDVIKASGILKKPEQFVIEESGRTFNYPAYLAKDGIRYILDKPKLQKMSGGEGSAIKRGFIAINDYFVRSVERVIPEPYAGFASGVVLGVDGALSPEDEEQFRTAGLVHVIVVSGYNTTLVGDVFARMLSRLPGAFASLGSLFGIVAFIMLVGSTSTAIRAGIMAGIVVLARLTKRYYDMNRALTLAASLMILHNPMILLYDPSFQLSFLATWGLSNLTPLTRRLFSWIPAQFSLRDIAATTLATQLAVTPLLLYMSGTASILSLPANIAVLPLVPAVMAGTLLIGALGFLPSVILLPFSWIVHGGSAYIFSIVSLIDRIPWSAIQVPAVSILLLMGVYTALFTLVWWRRKAAPSLEGAAGHSLSQIT